jgi:hypothetical protein
MSIRMLSNRLGVLAAMAALPALSQVSGDPASMEQMAPRQHRPILDRVENGNGTATSSNWSGYAVQGSSFTSATASWTVPAANCGSGDQYAACWVGIDGYSSRTVEQTGTDSDCVGGTPAYYAWYEFYPRPAFEFSSMTIQPGDRMSASVVYNGSEFTVIIEDVTTGESRSKTATVSSAQRSSAEWVVEASGGNLNLTDFGEVFFGEDSTSIGGTNYATDSAASGAIGAFPAVEAIAMTTGGATGSGIVKAYPSALSDGTSFSVIWKTPWW